MKQEVNISPFYGMRQLPIAVVLILILLLTTAFTAGAAKIIFGILLILAILYLVSNIYGRLSKPWRRLHFAITVKYSYFAGLLAHKALKYESSSYPSGFDARVPLQALLKDLYYGISDEEINETIEVAEDKLRNFTDEDELKDYMRRSNPTIDRTKLNEDSEKLHKHIMARANYNYFLIRYLIAEVVGQKYGKGERMKYLVAVFNGDAF